MADRGGREQETHATNAKAKAQSLEDAKWIFQATEIGFRRRIITLL
jgi:hypothetical protein